MNLAPPVAICTNGSIGINNSINKMSKDRTGTLSAVSSICKSLASSNGHHGKLAVFVVWVHRYVCKWRLFATYIMANGGIIAWRGREVMSRGRVEENTVKWMCSGGEMTSPPLSLSPSLSTTHTHNVCSLFMSPALHHCPSKPLTLSSLSSLPVPCLIAFPLDHYNTAYPHFILVLIFQETTALQQPRNIQKGHKRVWLTQTTVKRTWSLMSVHIIWHKREQRRGKGSRVAR